MRIVVTGGSGKLGRAVVARSARARVRRGQRWTGSPAAAAGARSPASTSPTSARSIEALTGIDDRYDGVDAVVHLAAIPAPGLRRTRRRSPTTSPPPTTCSPRPGRRHPQRRLGVQRDGARPAVRHAAAVPAGRRGVPGPAGDHYSLAKTLEEQMARQFCRWDPALKHDRAALLQRDGRRRTTRSSRRSTTTRAAQWNLWGYIDARDGAQAVRLALERRPARPGDLRRSPTPTP